MSCYVFILCNDGDVIYRILGMLFLGLTLSRGISDESGSPDIPRDKVSPKNKMPNILYFIYPCHMKPTRRRMVWEQKYIFRIVLVLTFSLREKENFSPIIFFIHKINTKVIIVLVCVTYNIQCQYHILHNRKV